MKTIKFRFVNKQKDNDKITFIYSSINDLEMEDSWQGKVNYERLGINLFTGLQDKSKDNTCIYEEDIVSLYGILIGNKHENANLLKDKTNLLISGFGTKTWCSTLKKAMARGCRYSE